MTDIKLPPLPHAELLALDPRVVGYVPAFTADQLRARDIAVAAAVREACAQFCDAWASHCSASIRAINIGAE